MDRPEAASRGAAGDRAAGPRAASPRAGSRGAPRRRAAWARAWLCAAVAALAAIVLAGCGSLPASSTGAASAPLPKASPSPSVSPGAAATQTALCRHTATVTGLEIMRNHVMHVPQLQIGFPEQVVVVSSAHARAVARAICGLPSLPRGVLNCPNLTVGTTYLLRFTADGRRLPAISIEATGCEVITGVGPARWAVKTPGFWRTLATAANLSPPGRAVFSGDLTSSCQPASSRTDQYGCPARITPETAVP
jgi:hypothetical protein